MLYGRLVRFVSGVVSTYEETTLPFHKDDKDVARVTIFPVCR